MQTSTRSGFAAGIAVLAILPFIATSSGAGEPPSPQSQYTKAYQDCPGFKSGITPDMLDCISAEFDIQDRRLNAAYVAAMRAMAPSRKIGLRAAQRAWISYRDAWCGVTYDKDSGQDEHIASNQCMLDETIRQAAELNELARYAAAGR